MRTFWKKKHFWGSLIALLLLAFCVKDIHSDDLRQLASRINLYYIIPTLALSFAMIIFKALRWKTIVERTKRISIGRIIPMFSAAQVVNIVMPALTGQVARIVLFARKEGLSKSYVFSTIVLEVLFDAISLLIFIVTLSAASFAFPKEYRQIGFIIAFATVALLAVLYLILHYEEPIGVLGKKLLRGRWPGVYITLKKFSRSFTKGLEMLKSGQYFIKTLIYSLASWVSHILVVYYLFKAFGLKLPILAATVVMVVNTIALMIPITPGNAGTFELAVVASLLAFKTIKSDAVLFALALHIIDLIPIFVMGSLFLFTKRVTMKEMKELQQEGEQEDVMTVEEDSTFLPEEDKV